MVCPHVVHMSSLKNIKKEMDCELYIPHVHVYSLANSIVFIEGFLDDGRKSHYYI